VRVARRTGCRRSANMLVRRFQRFNKAQRRTRRFGQVVVDSLGHVGVCSGATNQRLGCVPAHARRLAGLCGAARARNA
jgi:hypothetical protein